MHAFLIILPVPAEIQVKIVTVPAEPEIGNIALYPFVSQHAFPAHRFHIQVYAGIIHLVRHVEKAEPEGLARILPARPDTALARPDETGQPAPVTRGDGVQGLYFYRP